MDGQMGGCRCGAVRFRVTAEAIECGWCHCATCRKASGAPASAYASFPADAFHLVSGQHAICRERTSNIAARWWCGQCGTPLAIDYDRQPELIDLSVGALDEPGEVPPSFHIFWSSRLSWFDPDDALPRFNRFRPGSVLDD